jgi:hypothetical protein
MEVAGEGVTVVGTTFGGRRLGFVVAAVILQARDAEPGHAVAVEQALPSEKFLHRQLVAVAGVFQADGPRTDRGDDLGLAADAPPVIAQAS